MDDYTIEHKIGDGAQGVVYAVRHKTTKKNYAMKVCCTPQEQVNKALTEIKVLLKLKHPHIVSYIDFLLVFNTSQLRDQFQKVVEDSPNKDIVESSEERFYSLPTVSKKGLAGQLSNQHWLRDEEVAVCVVLELCSCGDMAKLIQSARSQVFATGKHPVKEKEVLMWIEQCADAFELIHNEGFCHRDIKPTNIFFDSDRNIKLGDFGLAANVGLGRMSTVGTPQYLAPELLLGERYDGKIDVWGLGAVLLELLTLEERPLNALILENKNYPETAVKKITRLGFSSELAALVKDMLHRQPAERPTAAAIRTKVRLLQNPSISKPPGLSMSFGGMSCPKLSERSCDWCASKPGTILCNECSAVYCEECDLIGHRHQSRKSHERTSISHLSGSDGQQTLSLSRPSPSNRSGSSATSESTHPRKRFSGGVSMPNASLSVSEPSLSHTFTRSTLQDSEIRVPRDFETLETALLRVKNMSHIRKIVVAGGTVIDTPLVLTADLPENLKIIGETPSPVLEVSGGQFALHCESGKGVVENFIIRNIGKRRGALKDVDSNSAGMTGNSNGKNKEAKPTHPNAVCITGGEWWLHKCRISCTEGSGISVGSNALDSPSSPEATKTASKKPLPTEVEPKVTKCKFIDVTIAGVDVKENARGSYEGNTFSGCGYVAFLLRENSAAFIRANHIADGLQSGIFCNNSGGTIEHNVIAKNKDIGIIVRGPRASPIFKKNKVFQNGQAGIYCCDRSHPIILENDIRANSRAGVMIKTGAAPTITKNTIEEGKEAGIYICEEGGGTIQENIIRGNLNAGLLVTTRSTPHVSKNVLSKNSYEGIWVCKGGGGTFCDNDLRGNLKGSKDIEKDCKVTWVGNDEN